MLHTHTHPNKAKTYIHTHLNLNKVLPNSFQCFKLYKLLHSSSNQPTVRHPPKHISNAFCTAVQWFSAQALCRCCTFCESFAFASSLRRTSQLRVVMDSLEGYRKIICDLLGKASPWGYMNYVGWWQKIAKRLNVSKIMWTTGHREEKKVRLRGQFWE